MDIGPLMQLLNKPAHLLNMTIATRNSVFESFHNRLFVYFAITERLVIG